MFLGLARRTPEETEVQKYIRAFADGGNMEKAKEKFRSEVLRLLRSDSLWDCPEILAFMAFGRSIFGSKLVESMLSEITATAIKEIMEHPFRIRMIETP
jgi:hypothetical protein